MNEKQTYDIEVYSDVPVDAKVDRSKDIVRTYEAVLRREVKGIE